MAALRAADWRYTRAWQEAMRACDGEDNLNAARDAYNARMAPAFTAWRDGIAAAHALGEPPQGDLPPEGEAF
jgi:hypothetical protein